MRALEVAVAPLDVARRATLQLATRSRWLTRVLGRRDSRVVALATFQVLVLFIFAVRAPVALFFVGPVLFGVAHLAADVRYLVLRQAPPRALLAGSVALAAALTATRAAVGLRHLSAPRGNQVDVAVGMLWIGFALAVALRGRLRLGLVVAPFFLALAGYFLAHAREVGLALVHLHNVIALVAWLVLFRSRAGWAILPLALVVALSAVLLSGAYLPWTAAHGGLLTFGAHAEQLGAWLAPGLSLERGVALAVTFVFLQGVHYATWTGWIPQDDLRTQGAPTFRMTVRTLRSDFGSLALAGIALLALAFVGVAVWDVRQSVAWYMNLSKAHAWFECAFLAYFVVSGQRLRAGASRA